MDSHTQVFFNFFPTFRTLLRSPPSVHFSEELSTLPAHILNDASKLSKCSIKHVFPKHPFSTGAVIQVFHEDHITSITKSVGLFVVKILPGIVDFVVKPRNFKALFLVVLRPIKFSTQPALQQFQLALQLLKELRRLYENTVTGCQKLLQSNINPDGMTMWNWVRNTDIALKRHRCIPNIGFSQDSHLLDRKSRGNRSVQVDGNCSNFGQFDVQVCYWILFKLGKQQRLELPILLESRKAKSTPVEILPTSMQLLNGLLKNLRRNFTQLRKFFLGSWQVIKLLNFVRKFQLRRKNVFFLQRASINQTLSAIAPILYFPQCIIKCAATDFHPLNQYLLLSGIRIDSVTVINCQHPSTINDLLVTSKKINVNFRDIESRKTNLGELLRTPTPTGR